MNAELFYDNQLSREELTWRLYASGEEPSSKSLVIKGLLPDVDLNYSVSHDYSGSDDAVTELANKVSGIMNQGVGTMRTANMINSTLRSLRDASGIANLASQGIDWVEGNIDRVTTTLLGKDFNTIANSRVVSAFDYIKVFKGTSVGIDLPELSTILFNDDEGSIPTKLSRVNSYLMGDISEVGGIFGLQESPNNYVPTYRALDPEVEFEGTFTLELGKSFTIPDLIVKDFKVNLSQIRDKDRNDSKYPLYAEVTISVDFAAYVSKKTISDIFKLK